MLSVTVTLFPDCLTEGLMLAMNQDSMRIALKGATDVLELRRVKGQWFAENDRPVEFEVLLTDGHAPLEYFEPAPAKVMTAGCC